jgi:hypothetical protein
MAQSSQFYAGMGMFGSQILVQKVCGYIKSGQTFKHCAVILYVHMKYQLY